MPENNNETSQVMLGPNDRLIGELHIEGNLRVSGTLEGQIEATGDVEVTEAAKVKASVMGREVNVSGLVSGPVVASKKLVIGKSGSVVGDVRVPRLVMQDGATLSGNVQMGSHAAQPEPAPAPAPVELEVVAEAATDGQAIEVREPEKQKAKRR